MDPKTEITIRLGLFVGVLLAMLLWEQFAPRRRPTVRRALRRGHNLALVVLNTIVARLVLPISAVAAAEACGVRGWGLLARIDAPAWAETLTAVVLLDLAIYLQHVAFHAVPILWRLHRVHHADLDFDVTTGLRFHTLEIVLSALIKLAAIALLGPSPLAVILFEVLLNATAMFNHGNVSLPKRIEPLVRALIVTPDMHRIHHSIERSETNSNFGFNLSCWDRLFRTYRAEPQAGQDAMTIGIESWRNEQQVERLPGMLALPFVDPRRDD